MPEEQAGERFTWSCDNCGHVNSGRRKRRPECRTSRFQDDRRGLVPAHEEQLLRTTPEDRPSA